jgi:septum site-determining protein MinD
MKTKILTEVVGGHVYGAIVNRATPESMGTISQKMEKVLGTRVIGMIPEDPNVRKAASAKNPVVLRYPASGSSIAFKKIAADLAGITYDEKTMQPKDSFIDRFSRVLFRGRK